jgi:hypothetical protein
MDCRVIRRKEAASPLVPGNDHAGSQASPAQPSRASPRALAAMSRNLSAISALGPLCILAFCCEGQRIDAASWAKAPIGLKIFDPGQHTGQSQLFHDGVHILREHTGSAILARHR